MQVSTLMCRSNLQNILSLTANEGSDFSARRARKALDYAEEVIQRNINEIVNLIMTLATEGMTFQFTDGLECNRHPTNII